MPKMRNIVGGMQDENSLAGYEDALISIGHAE